MKIDRKQSPENMNLRKGIHDIKLNRENILGYAKHNKFQLIDNISVFIFPELRETLISLSRQQMEKFKEQDDAVVLAEITKLLFKQYL